MAKVKSLITTEWQDGYEACQVGMTAFECPYIEGSEEAVQWLSGWQSCDFDDRAAEQFTLMENMEASHGQAA